MLPSNMTYLTFISYMTYDKCHIKKIPYVIMGVNICVSTSTMQPPAPKLSKVHLNILNLKKKKNKA